MILILDSLDDLHVSLTSIYINNRQQQRTMQLCQDSSDEEIKPQVHPSKDSSNSIGWSDLFLKDELRRVIKECRFERPSQVQMEAIPTALQGCDLLCQSKSGTGKTMVFVVTILNSLVTDRDTGEYLTGQAIIIANTRELAHQIFKDFLRMGRYFRQPELRASCFFGGISLEENCMELTKPESKPHIIVGTPGRMLDLVLRGTLQMGNCNFFVIDECDKVLDSDMSEIIRQLMNRTPFRKQVMMFSATLNQKRQLDYKKWMVNPMTILVDQGQLILHGLNQYYLRVPQEKKFDKLVLLLDTLAFNQVIIFANRVERAKKLTELLKLKLFNPICIHSSLRQQERIKNYDSFKANGSRLLVATDLFGRGIDIERVNLVINYDFPQDRDTYLHRVGRAGRFNTRGLAVNFLLAEGEDDQVMADVQNGFKVKIAEMPSQIDPVKYV